MQNKGFVIFVTSVLAIICAFYLSFSFVTGHYDKKAERMGAVAGGKYLDSMANEKVWMGYTLNEARKQQVGLGLDLKGGMSVVLKLNAGDLLRNLANRSSDPNFEKAIEHASDSRDQKNFIDVFCDKYLELSPSGSLRVLFAQGPLREQITAKTTDPEVRKMIKDKYEAAVAASFNVIRARIDGFGVASPNLQQLEGEGRILVELPGVKDPARVRDLLSRSANLQFWRTYMYPEIEADLINANNRLSEIASKPQSTPVATVADSTLETSQTTQSSLAERTTAGTDTTSNKIAEEATPKDQKTTEAKGQTLFSLLTPQNRGGAVVGIAHRADIPAIDSMLKIAQQQKLIRDDLRLMWGAKVIQDPTTRKPTDIYELYAIRWSPSGEPDLSGNVVTEAKSDINNNFGHSEPVVSMAMNTEGSRKWARITKDNIGRPLAIVLDGIVYSAPNIKVEITGGRSEISGNFTVEEAADLANVLSSGKMETSVVIEQENVIGPSLGHEAIEAGVISFIIAIILLMIYMCLAYGLIPGMIANSALIVNSFFTIGILAAFKAVLTLPGIAGLVLTLGMAVDANVLIFERIKEELRAGKNMSRAIADGYGNAFSAIFDSNLTTIITGVVLFYFGTGPIKGFATTLIIGLVASFITAVFLTRLVFEALVKSGKADKFTYTTFMTRNLLVSPKFNILGKRKVGMIIPSVVILLGLVGLFTIKLNKGIEFSGGRNFTVQFDKKVGAEQVREELAATFDGKVLVTTIGTAGNEVRIATNYKIEEESEVTDKEIQAKLFDGLKSFYDKKDITQEEFQQKILSQQKVSPSMSSDISREAIIAVIIAMFFMALYILIRFRNIAFSAGVFVSVTATTLCIIACYVLLWRIMPFTMELDSNFVAALLAIIGYSLNDTVVVFDRIRETIKLYPTRDRFQVMNDALNSTLSRTLNTTLTTFMVMFVIFFLGGATMRSFTFAILIGIIIGTYCTLFVATPVAYLIQRKSLQKKAEGKK